MLFKLVFLSLVSLNLSSVVELTDTNFESSIKGKNAFVMFYSPNCGHCKRLKPTYDALPSKDTVKSTGVLIAKVDCTDKGKSTCSKYNVNGFPTLKFFNFNDGEHIVTDYDGNRESEDLQHFVLLNNREPLTEIKDSELNKFIISKTLPVVIAFVNDKNSKIFKSLKQLAPSYKKDYLIGFSYSKSKALELGLKMESVNIYRQVFYQSKMENHVQSVLSEKDISNFLASNKHSLVEFRNRKNSDIFLNPHITVFVKFDPFMKKSATKRIRLVVLRQAKKHSQIKFSISLGNEFEDFVSEIASSATENDLIIFGTDANGKKFVGPKFAPFDEPKQFEAILEQFISDFLAGNVLKPYIKSQPADTPDDENVKVVTAHTFKEIVLDSDKDVLIEFYAPWCGHCKKLAPIYQQLATMLKDEPNLIIAKYDATANEEQKGYEIQGFPTIFFAKSSKKTSPMQYGGNRDAQSMLNFIKQNVKHPLKFDGKIPELKEEL